jgi:Na+/H+-dicarboxylate symporter
VIGIDRLMNEVRALTNLVGNAVAALVVARWEGEIDLVTARSVLDGELVVEEEPAFDGNVQPIALPVPVTARVAA